MAGRTAAVPGPRTAADIFRGMTADVALSPDEHRWTLTGHRLTQLAVDLTSFRFQTWTLAASAEIRVATPFVFHEPDGVRRRLDPEEPEQLAPLLSLLGRTIELLVVTRRGELRVAFGDGSVLESEPHPRANAWEIQGGGALEGMAYRCPPGGGAPW